MKTILIVGTVLFVVLCYLFAFALCKAAKDEDQGEE